MLKRLSLIVFLFLIGTFFIFSVFLWRLSPGKTSPITDSYGYALPNSITTIEKPIIGGVPQGLIIRGANRNNPVLLFVHGGPGTPAYSLLNDKFKRLEHIFTICYWEQRGAGMSYSKDLPMESLTLTQLVEDAADVTQYLLKKFNQEKIYILGHSWGSLLASFVVNKYPKLYIAYLGVGQMADTYQSERLSYEFVVAQAQDRKDEKALKVLRKLVLPNHESTSKQWYKYLMTQRQYVSKYGGANHLHPLTLAERGKALLFCHEYTIGDKLNYKAGVEKSLNLLWNTTLNNNLNVVLNKQFIPVYIFAGIHDYQTSFMVAKQYFNILQAPVKKFYTFPNAAHWLFLEDYETFEKIIIEDIIVKQTQNIQAEK